MLDVKLIIENPQEIAAKLAKKGCKVDFEPLLKLVAKRKELFTFHFSLLKGLRP